MTATAHVAVVMLIRLLRPPCQLLVFGGLRVALRCGVGGVGNFGGFGGLQLAYSNEAARELRARATMATKPR